MSSNPPLRCPRKVPSRWSAAYAWGAGAAFVASLAYFLHFYTVALERRQPAARGPAGRLASVLLDVALFAGFAAHHSIMARSWAKQWLTRTIPPDLERATYVWTASALFLLTCRWWQSIPGELYRASGRWSWLPRAAQVLGVGLVARSSAALDVLDLAGIRQATGKCGRRKAEWGMRWPEGSMAEGGRRTADLRSPSRDPEGAESGPRHATRDTAAELITTGPYGLVRHPLYLGWILLVFGTRRMTWNRLLFATMSSAYLVIAIEWEEQSLVETFGGTYHAYAREVTWKLVPRVY
jgi:methanethiol S-methyltransferase